MEHGWLIKMNPTDAPSTTLCEHQVQCGCGWTGPVRSDHASAERDGQEHAQP